MSLTRVRELVTELLESNQRIDYYCWDLYARVSQWYTADAESDRRAKSDSTGDAARARRRWATRSLRLPI